MNKGKYFISLFLFFSLELKAQKWNWELKDSVNYDINEVYIDRLNQIYILPKNSSNLIKLNEDLSINQEISSPFISEFVFMDVKDPMKLMLFLPQFANVNIYDESLAQLSDEYFSDFNNESGICFFSSYQLCYFTNNRINLRNLKDGRTNSGEPIFYSRKKVNEVTQLKSNGQDIFLLIPGVGLWHFNLFLNIDSFLEDYQIKRIEIIDNELYLLKENVISKRRQNEISDQVVFTSLNDPIYTFAINKKYLLIAEKNKLRRYILAK